MISSHNIPYRTSLVNRDTVLSYCVGLCPCRAVSHQNCYSDRKENSLTSSDDAVLSRYDTVYVCSHSDHFSERKVFKLETSLNIHRKSVVRKRPRHITSPSHCHILKSALSCNLYQALELQCICSCHKCLAPPTVHVSSPLPPAFHFIPRLLLFFERQYSKEYSHRQSRNEKSLQRC